MISRDPILANYNAGGFEKKLFENGSWENFVQYGFLNTGAADTSWTIPPKYTELFMSWSGVKGQPNPASGLWFTEVKFNNYNFSITGDSSGVIKISDPYGANTEHYFGSLSVRVGAAIMYGGPITWNSGSSGFVYLTNGPSGYYTPAWGSYNTEADFMTDFQYSGSGQFMLSPGFPITSLGIRRTQALMTITSGYVNIWGRVA